MEVDGFAINGFALLPGVLADDECARIATQVASVAAGSPGTRCLLPHAWCKALAERLKGHPALAAFIPPSFVAAQCTYFEKSRSRNWLVAVHQDLSIPVAARISNVALQGWTEKEGELFVQAPAHLLRQLVAVRLHIDDCTLNDGPLRVVPGSHLHGRVGPEDAVLARQTVGEVVCVCPSGGALVMRPLLLHASSKAIGNGKRRVLHFLFGPYELPYGLQWQHAA
jgi:phytanoyl-CoA dioxygenase PhyH